MGEPTHDSVSGANICCPGLQSVQYHNPTNIGEVVSSPFLYFYFGPCEHHCLTRYTWDHTRPMVVGGGGLLWPPGKCALGVLRQIKRERVVVWGIGLNAQVGPADFYDDTLDRFDLVGVRDWQTKYLWVPCASCLHPALNNQGPIEHDIVVYEAHPERAPLQITGYPKASNRNTTMHAAVRFLSSGAVVVTNSYHGMYWATLLGRRVVVIPLWNRSKFFFFRYPHIHASPENFLDAVSQARAFPESLHECRAANVSFADRVGDVLGIPLRAKESESLKGT